MPPNSFEWVTEEMGETEKQELLDKLEAEKQEWMKRTKAKPKTEEEDAEDLANLLSKMTEVLREKLVTSDTIMGDID
jgi:flagellar biosynthesis/type III secretory pathway chaperone